VELREQKPMSLFSAVGISLGLAFFVVFNPCLKAFFAVTDGFLRVLRSNLYLQTVPQSSLDLESGQDSRRPHLGIGRRKTLVSQKMLILTRIGLGVPGVIMVCGLVTSNTFRSSSHSHLIWTKLRRN